MKQIVIALERDMRYSEEEYQDAIMWVINDLGLTTNHSTHNGRKIIEIVDKLYHVMFKYNIVGNLVGEFYYKVEMDDRFVVLKGVNV